MGEKEIFFLFLLSFCLISFVSQPMSTDAASIASISAPIETISYNH